jgi:DNA-binding response OmpR family regulator
MVKKNVLIIEDDQEMCLEIADILEDEGYCVNMAFDGLKGKEFIEKFSYDILLLDLNLPGLCGFDILKMVKEREKKLKVLVITGRPLYDALSGERESFEEGVEETLKIADGIFSKPFDIMNLIDRIEGLLIGHTKR